MSSVEDRFDPLDPAFPANRLAVYRHFLEHDRVHFGKGPALGRSDAWYVFGYEEAQMALTDNRFIRQLPGAPQPAIPEVIRPFIEMTRQWMLFKDPPDHTRLRALVSKAFTPKRIRLLQPRITEVVDFLLNDLPSQGSMDLMTGFAYPLPVIVIAELLGIPPDDRPLFRDWSAALSAAVDIRSSPEITIKASRMTMEIQAYLQDILNRKRNDPSDDLISALLDPSGAMDTLLEGELVTMCITLLVAGHETTMNMIGNGVLALLQHRDQFNWLRDHPDKTSGAVEEILRYNSPVQMTFRFITEDLELGNRHLRKGEQVGIVLGAANMDPLQFQNPEKFDLSRRPGRLASFGFGNHYCLGASLARLEGEIAFSALTGRFPGLKLVREQPDWRPSILFAGLNTLEVQV